MGLVHGGGSCRANQAATWPWAAEGPHAATDPLSLARSRMCFSGLPCPLQQLTLHLNEPDGTLMSAVRRHVRLAALSLSVATPAALEWLPQLQHCTIWVPNSAQLDLLNNGLDADAARQLFQLSQLVINDERAVTERELLPPAFPALAHLPALRKLVSESECSWAGWQVTALEAVKVGQCW